MRVLLLGGTLFLGRHLVEALQASGHGVTLFNRGQTAAGLFPATPHIRGDRDVPADLARLSGQRFDAVVDTSGYAPGSVRAAVRQLAASIDRYAFVSSVSVYDMTRPNVDERSPTLELPSGFDPDAYDEEQYGAYKALCERQVLDAFGNERGLIVRPGLIVGPYDPTDRFTYWPWRIARGGDVLVPESPQFVTQFIDVRDVAAFIVRALESSTTGTYNVTSDPGHVTLGDVFAGCKYATGSHARLVWVDERFLHEHDVQPWSDLPLWVPTSAQIPGLLSVNTAAARSAGLALRPLAETIADTASWLGTRGPNHVWHAGLEAKREAELLDLCMRARETNQPLPTA